LKLSLPTRQVLTYANADGYGYRPESPVGIESLRFVNLAEWAIYDFAFTAAIILVTYILGFVTEKLRPGTDVYVLLIPLVMGLARVAISLINFGVVLAW
jgi:hypothetical protein